MVAADLDVLTIGILLVIMLIVVVLYLYVRRAVVGFREGMNEGRRKP
jgi:uncharacterized membrane protein